MATDKSTYIDLTGDGDDDEVEPMLRLEPRGTNAYGRPQASMNNAPPTSSLSATTTLQTPYFARKTGSTHFTGVVSREQPVVQPLDWSRARRNHAYDSATIASSVLVATGSHPDYGGLNAHLAVLKTQYITVNDLSDLSTLRGDLIKAPAVVATSQTVIRVATIFLKTVPVLEFVLPSIESFERCSNPVEDTSSQSTSGAGSDEVSPQWKPTSVSLEQSELTSPPEPCQELDILSSNPGESPAWSSPISSQPPYINMPPAPGLPSFQILPIHSAPSPTREGVLSKGRGSHGPSSLRNSTTLGRNLSTFQILVTSPSQPRTGYVNFQPGVDSVGSTAPASGNSSTSETARRGRLLTGNPTQPPSTSAKKRGRPFKNPNDSQSASPAPGAKKRGRPFKTAEAEAAAAGAFKHPVVKRRGRPPKGAIEPIFLPAPEPKFHPFICEWEGCPAELQNLKTLRAHLFDVHVKRPTEEGDALTCLWGSCGAAHVTRDSAPAAATKILKRQNRFPTKRELRNHLTDIHLVPQALHMGDGPRGTSLEIRESTSHQRTSPWLYDARGEQVTPSFEDFPVENGAPKDINARRFVRRREGLDIVLHSIGLGDSLDDG